MYTSTIHGLGCRHFKFTLKGNINVELISHPLLVNIKNVDDPICWKFLSIYIVVFNVSRCLLEVDLIFQEWRRVISLPVPCPKPGRCPIRSLGQVLANVATSLSTTIFTPHSWYNNILTTSIGTTTFSAHSWILQYSHHIILKPHKIWFSLSR